MAVGFSLSQQRLDAETRKASRNPRHKDERYASRRTWEVEARRESVLPWASPRTQTFRVSADEHPRVVKQLQRDGWVTRSRKLRRGA